MGTEENKAQVRRWFEEGISSNSVEFAKSLADEIFTDDFVDGDGPDAPVGREAFKHQVVDHVFQAFSEVKVVMEEMCAEGDLVAGRLRFTGVHTGEYMGIPPTGRRITFTETGMSRFAEDGRIASSMGDWDRLGMLRQLESPDPPGPSDPPVRKV